MMPVRVCRDCIHHDGDTKQCLHEKATITNLVTGEPQSLDSYTMRIHRCGSAGKLWEPWPDVQAKTEADIQQWVQEVTQ